MAERFEIMMEAEETSQRIAVRHNGDPVDVTTDPQVAGVVWRMLMQGVHWVRPLVDEEEQVAFLTSLQASLQK